MHDYSDYVDDTTPTNLDTVLIQLADELQAAQALVAQKEQELQDAKDAMKDIAEVRIPNATDGLEGKFTLSDGRTLEVKEDIRSSIAGEKRVPAINWLDVNGYGHIVKRELTFSFGKGSDEQVAGFRRFLSSFEDLPPMKEQFAVHHATLNAWVKEQLAEGVDLPRETFGIYRQRVAKIKE